METFQHTFRSAYHPLTDGQTEVVNHSLGDLLCKLVGSNLKTWDQKLPQAEFAYNRIVNRSTGLSPLTIVYGINPQSPLDLAPVPDLKRANNRAINFINQLKHIHEGVKKKLMESNAKYKAATDKKWRHVEFNVGDFVWAVLPKDHFPVGE